IPGVMPLFVNLTATPEQKLRNDGGAFGQVLHLLRHRTVKGKRFRALLQEVLRSLESLQQAERDRWLELLSYIVALVYYCREGDEVTELQDLVEAAVQTDTVRKEVFQMGKTAAETLRDEGRREEALKTRQQTLVRQLRLRFKKKVTPAMVAAIE